jgi:uncharacterized membrane protein
MLILLVGIVLLLGVHSLGMFGDTRANLIERLGQTVFRGLYSVLSLAGIALIVWGFSSYRQHGWIQLWTPPAGMRHLTITLMWFAFVALGSMHQRPAKIAGWLRHPMLAGIKIWALAHLLANGDTGGMLLFGSFLAWAVIDRIALKRRGDLGAARVASFTSADAFALGAGTLAYLAMIALHPILIGVAVL